MADQSRVERGVAEPADVLAGLALRLIVEQRALEDEGVRGVDDDQPRDARRLLQRRQPRDRAAPVVTDQREAIDAEMIGECDQVGDDLVGRIALDAVRLGRARIAALVWGEDEMVPGEIGDDVAPRPVRFGKAVQQDDGRMTAMPRDLDVELDAGRKGDTVERVGHCLSPDVAPA